MLTAWRSRTSLPPTSSSACAPATARSWRSTSTRTSARSPPDDQELIRSLQAKVKDAGASGRRTSRRRPAGPARASSRTRCLNEEIGRSTYAQLVFGCQAPDAGNARDPAPVRHAEQKERWLFPLVAGEIRSFFSMTEPEVSGSDPTTLRTRAVRDGDEWVIDGHKWFSSGADGAAFGIVMAVTDPDATPHCARVADHRARRHAGRRGRPADPGARPRGQRLVDALRGLVPRRARAGREHARRAGRRVPDRAEAARAGPHPPRDALARPDAARVRADVLATRSSARRSARGSPTSRRSRTGSPTRPPASTRAA